MRSNGPLGTSRMPGFDDEHTRSTFRETGVPIEHFARDEALFQSRPQSPAPMCAKRGERADADADGQRATGNFSSVCGALMERGGTEFSPSTATRPPDRRDVIAARHCA
jgi:hypothetical protein